MVKIAVLASFNMDLVMRVDCRPEAGETLQGEFAMHLGGKGFNQAVAARRLGAEVAVCGRVGDDEFGRLFLAALDEEGIDRQAVAIHPAAGTGVATIYVEPDGTNTIVQAPRANRYVALEQVAIVHEIVHGYDCALLAQFETSPEALIALSKTFANCDHICCFDAPFILNPAPAMRVSNEVLGLADYIVPNRLELELLTDAKCPDIDSVKHVAQRLAQRAGREVLVTLGHEGAMLSSSGLSTHAGGFDVRVVDTTGAGDAFCAAIAVRVAGIPRAGVDADAMRFANAAGALACTKHGAYPSMPYRADVEELMRQQGSSR